MSGQPKYEWNKYTDCFVNDYGTPIIWTDGSCPKNHLGPNGGATSGIGVYIHDENKWSVFNDRYDHTNQVSSESDLSTQCTVH